MVYGGKKSNGPNYRNHIRNGIRLATGIHNAYKAYKSQYRTVKETSADGHSSGHGIQTVKWSIKRRETIRSKAIKNATPNFLQDATQANVISAQARQAYQTIYTDFDKTMFDLFVAATSTTEKKMWFDSVQHVLQFTNMTNIPVTFDVYYVMCKNDSNQEPVSTIQDGIYQRFNGTADMADKPYMEPTMSMSFNHNYKIRKHHTFHLSPGSVGKVTLYRQMNLMYNTELQRDGDSYYAHLTGAFVVRLLSSPATNGSDITFPAAKVITTMATRIKYRFPIGQADTQVGGLQIHDWDNAATGIHYMNEDTGVIVPTGTG